MKRKKTNKFYLKLIIKIFILLFFCYLIFFYRFQLELNKNFFKNISLIEYLIIKPKLEKEIFQKYPEIVKIKTNFSFLTKKINLETIEEKPVAEICYLNNCYFLGEHSYIYKKPQRMDNLPLLKIESQIKILPSSILEKNISLSLAKIFEYSNNQNLVLTKVEILSNKDLKFLTKKFSFLIDPNKDIEEQIRKLNYFLKNYSKDFSLIDLRISKKIYFK
ncbi:MAG: hypothetical protein NZ866_00675 [Patescibacteria group bacterium]|nr:hypothetical protein [Patescibacteria group bacterium]